MSHKEKENIVSLISTLIVSIPYFTYIILRFNNSEFTTEEELKYWAGSILLIIPFRIVAQILVFIAFAIGKAIVTGDEKISDFADERDKLIELKGDRNTTNFFIFGVMSSMIAVVAGGSLSTMFIIILISGFLGELIGIFSKIYYYRIRV